MSSIPVNEVVLPLLFGMILSAFILTAALAEKGSRRWPLGLTLAGALLGLLSLGFALTGQNFVMAMIKVVLNGKQMSLAGMAIGLSCGALAAYALVGFTDRPWQRVMTSLAYLIAVTFLCALANFTWIRGLVVEEERSIAVTHGPIVAGFMVEEVHTLNVSPTSLAFGPDGHLYVAGYWGDADHRGMVVKLVPQASGGFTELTVVDRLNRPHGIAFHGGDLFISRSGQYSRAIGGRMQIVNTGAITRATDLNGDGVYDHLIDVIDGLPGAKGGLHQNNGLAFDADGWMYVTNGIPDDHKPPVHPYEGTIIRAKPDGTEAQIFARGFRNPYDLAFGPDGELFGTDNDDDNKSALGDKFNHIIEGGHYGHPYATFSETIDVTGLQQPILRDRHLQGLVYIAPGDFPAGYDDSFYAATWFNGQVIKIKLQPSGDGYTGTSEWFADLPQVIDLTFEPESGAMYAASYGSRLIYRITPQ